MNEWPDYFPETAGITMRMGVALMSYLSGAGIGLLIMIALGGAVQSLRAANERVNADIEALRRRRR